MTGTDPVEALRAAIDRERDQLAASLPGVRRPAVLAVMRTQEMSRMSGTRLDNSVVFGAPVHSPGSNLAWPLLLKPGSDDIVRRHIDGDALDAWAASFQQRCDSVAIAETVLGHVASGVMRLTQDAEGEFRAWIASRRLPAAFRERIDAAWWQAQATTGLSAMSGGITEQEARTIVDALSYQIGLPRDREIEGIAVGTFMDGLAQLMVLASASSDADHGIVVLDWEALVRAVAERCQIDADMATRVLRGFRLDGDNARWHASVPGIAPAPMIDSGEGRVAISLEALSLQPLLFLARELRRRGANAYHDASHGREDRFREDVYRLFGDSRFVTSAGRIVLRRDRGDLRTDVDAAVFDRKTGALAVFELKSQDPFARSHAEFLRQRDNMLYANRQVSGVLAWISQHGADDLVSRFNNPLTKRFRATRVHPFVLGRFIAHFDDGPTPDQRAAWGTWPQLLRLLGAHPIGPKESNPIASLHARLRADAAQVVDSDRCPSITIAIGDSSLAVSPSLAVAREPNGPE